MSNIQCTKHDIQTTVIPCPNFTEPNNKFHIPENQYITINRLIPMWLKINKCRDKSSVNNSGNM